MTEKLGSFKQRSSAAFMNNLFNNWEVQREEERSGRRFVFRTDLCLGDNLLWNASFIASELGGTFKVSLLKVKHNWAVGWKQAVGCGSAVRAAALQWESSVRFHQRPHVEASLWRLRAPLCPSISVYTLYKAPFRCPSALTADEWLLEVQHDRERYFFHYK